MVNNSGNSQTQRELMIHVETRQDLPITNEETLDKSADSACWIVVDASRRLGIPPLSSLPLSRGGTDGRATFFKIKFTARSNGDDRSPSTRTCTHHLSSGRRWCRCSLRPGSSTSSSLSHHRSTASSIPLSAALALPCYRVCDRGREISFGAWPVSKVFFNEPCCVLFFPFPFEDELFFFVRGIFDTIYVLYKCKSRIITFFFFIKDFFHSNLECKILFRINIFTQHVLNFHILLP